MKIFDCFMYYDEDILLDVRLNTLDKNVDYFVIVESDKSFTGNKKNNILSKKSSLNFHVNSKIYNVIENLHQILLLTAIDSIKLNKIK